MSRGDRIWEPGGLTLADSFGHIGAILSSSSFLTCNRGLQILHVICLMSSYSRRNKIPLSYKLMYLGTTLNSCFIIDIFPVLFKQQRSYDFLPLEVIHPCHCDPPFPVCLHLRMPFSTRIPSLLFIFNPALHKETSLNNSSILSQTSSLLGWFPCISPRSRDEAHHSYHSLSVRFPT